MGNPSLPLMIGLLAVPVGVLVFVVVLALMGGRWTAPPPGGEPAERVDVEDVDELEDLDDVEDLAGFAGRVGPVPPRHEAAGRPYPPEPAAQRYTPALRPYVRRPPGTRPALEPPRPPYRQPYRHPSQPHQPSPEWPYARPPEDDPGSRQPEGFPYGPFGYQ